jgi:hypothetical protein
LPLTLLFWLMIIESAVLKTTWVQKPHFREN